MSEFEELLQAFGFVGGDRSVLENRSVAHMVAVGHRILSARNVEGLEVEAHETRDGIDARVTVRDGVKIDQPVHMCFGVVHKRGSQRIRMDVRMEENSSAHFMNLTSSASLGARKRPASRITVETTASTTPTHAALSISVFLSAPRYPRISALI